MSESADQSGARADVECGSCGEGSPTGECPKSKRSCGHHCNHVWTHDSCDWCGYEAQPDQSDTAAEEVGCTCTRYVVDYSDPERYHPENVDREEDSACPVHGDTAAGGGRS